jgi:hypothetical protein
MMRAPARAITRSIWAGGYLWQGTKAQLVDAGVVTAAQMAAACAWRPPGRRPSIMLANGRIGVIKRDPGSRVRWLVYEELSDDELAVRERDVQARQRARAGADPAAARQSAEALLRAGVCTIAEAFNLVDRSIDGSTAAPAHRFDARTVAITWRALRELVQAFNAGALTMVPAPRQADADFERFLQSVLHKGDA